MRPVGSALRAACSGACLLLLPTWAAAAPQPPPPTPQPVAAALQKLGDNQPLNPAEMTTLTKWYGGASALADVGLAAERESDEEQHGTLRANPLVRLAGVKPPSRDEYLALATEVQALFGKRLDADLRAKLDSALKQATREGYGADLGAVLMGVEATPAAAYATATDALKDPTDAITASNLGAALKLMREYPRALRALLYAHSLAPNQAIPLTNLGWVQALMGDTVTADQTLQRALGIDPTDACAAEGLANLAMLRGDARAAIRYLMASVKSMYLPGTAKATEVLIDTEYVGGEGKGTQDGKAGGPGAGGLPPLEPIGHPAGKGGGQGPTFQEPPDFDTVEAIVGNRKAIEAWVKRGTQEIAPVAQQFGVVAGRGGVARARRQATPGVWYRTNERERFVLDNLKLVFEQRILRIYQEQRFEELADEMSARAAAIDAQNLPAGAKCEARRALARTIFEKWHPRFQTYRDQVLKDLVDYFHFCTPWIQDIHERDYNQERNLARELTIRAWDTIVRGHLQAWAGHFDLLYCEQQPPTGRPQKGVLKMWPSDPTDCRGPALKMGLGIVSLEGDCDKLKLEGGEGLILSAEYKVGENWHQDELTLFVGIGGKASVGQAGEFSAKAGSYVTFRDGEMIDVGDRGEYKTEVSFGPLKVGSKLEGRLSVETGATAKFTPVYGKLGGKVPGD